MENESNTFSSSASPLQAIQTSPKCIYKTPNLRRNLFNKMDNINNLPSITDFHDLLYNNQDDNKPLSRSDKSRSVSHSQQKLNTSVSDSSHKYSSISTAAIESSSDNFCRHSNIFLTLAESLKSSYHSDVTFLVYNRPTANGVDNRDRDDDDHHEPTGSEPSPEFQAHVEQNQQRNQNENQVEELEPEFEIFKAHKLILSFGSPVFDTMFFGSMPEAAEIQILDICPTSFRVMLEFIYTGHLMLPENFNCNNDTKRAESVATAINILYAARKYDIPHLESLICIHLEQRIALHTVVPILQASLLYESAPLQQKCWDYIEYYTDDFVRFGHFQDLPKDILKQLLMRDCLSIKEIHLFRGLLEWAKHEQEHQNTNTPENPDILGLDLDRCRSTLKGLVELIRFPCMSAAEFADGPAQCGLLTEKEICNVFMHICSSKDNDGDIGIGSGGKDACLFPKEHRRWKNPHIYSTCACAVAPGDFKTNNIMKCNYCLPRQAFFTRTAEMQQKFLAYANGGGYGHGRQIPNLNLGNTGTGVSSLLNPATPPKYCSCRTRNFCPGNN